MADNWQWKQQMSVHNILIRFGLALTLFFSTCANAAPPQWVSIGPFGGNVGTLRFDPNVKGEVYAITSAGVFGSTNSGASWIPLTNSIGPLQFYIGQGPQRDFRDVAFSAGQKPDLYVLTSQAAYEWNRSSSTWQQIFYVYDPIYNLQEGGSTAEQLQVDPFNSKHLIILGTFSYLDPNGSSNTYDRATEFESTDGGATFHVILPPAGTQAPTGLLHFAAGRAGLVFANAAYQGNGGLMVSLDDGKTWHSLNTPSSSADFVPSDPDPNRIYAIDNPAGVNGAPTMYRSDDSGTTWQMQSSMPMPHIYAPYIFMTDPVDPDTVYVSSCLPTGQNPPQNLYKSNDGGKTWTELLGFGAGGISQWCTSAAAIDPSEGNHVLAGIQEGVGSSFDGGQSFLPTNSGLSAMPVVATAIDNSLIPNLIVGEGGGYGEPVRSTDGGMHWYPFGNGLPQIDSLGLPIPQGMVAAGNDWFNPQYAYGVTSSNVGVLSPSASAWASIDTLGTYKARVDGSPITSGTLYLNWTDSSSQYIFASTDYGTTWKNITTSPTCTVVSCDDAPFPFAPSHVTANLLYYVSPIPNAVGQEVLRSTNGGSTWAPVTGTALPQSCSCNSNLESDASSDQILFWSDGGSIFKTTDSASTWTRVYNYHNNSNPFFVNGIYADPVNHGNIYGLLNTGTVLSTDDGNTWGPMPNSGLENHDVVMLKHVPWNSGYSLAGTTDSGLFSLTTPTNLAVTALGGSGEIAVGTAVPITLTVMNNGSVTAQPASLDLLPSGNATLSVSSLGGATCVSAGSGISGEQICNLPSLAPGASWSFGVNVTPNSVQAAALTAWVISLQGESDWSDNAVTQVLYPVPLADIAVSLSPTPGNLMVQVPAALFTVSVSNNGPETASAKLFISYDTSVSNATITPALAGCTALNSGYECVLGPSSVRSATTLTISGTVAVPGTLSATATAVPVNITDSDDSNNVATLVQTVAPPPAPTVTGTSSQTVIEGSSASAEPINLTGTQPLTLSVSSDNAALLPSKAINVSSGCGISSLSCIITLAPISSRTGTANITVTVQDPYGQSGHQSFSLTVTASNASQTTSSGGGKGGGGIVGLLEVLILLSANRWRRQTRRSGI